jgi:hypothetical protein
MQSTGNGREESLPPNQSSIWHALLHRLSKGNAFVAVLILIALSVFLLLCKIYSTITINTNTANFYPSPSTIVLWLLTFIGGIITIVHFFDKVIAAISKEDQRRVFVHDKLDRIERHQHWLDVANELEFEILRAVAKQVLPPEVQAEFDAKLTHIIMQRIPTDNPAYQNSLHIRDYLCNWAKSEMEKGAAKAP